VRRHGAAINAEHDGSGQSDTTDAPPNCGLADRSAARAQLVAGPRRGVLELVAGATLGGRSGPGRGEPPGNLGRLRHDGASLTVTDASSKILSSPTEKSNCGSAYQRPGSSLWPAALTPTSEAMLPAK
jgi:hypothetical protein